MRQRSTPINPQLMPDGRLGFSPNDPFISLCRRRSFEIIDDLIGDRTHLLISPVGQGLIWSQEHQRYYTLFPKEFEGYFSQIRELNGHGPEGQK